MDQTSFYQTSNEHERVLLMMIELGHPIFGFQYTDFEQLLNLIGPSLDLTNYLSNTFLHRFFEHQTGSKVFTFW